MSAMFALYLAYAEMHVPELNDDRVFLLYLHDNRPPEWESPRLER